MTETLEEFRNVSTRPDDSRYVKEILEDESVLIQVKADEVVPDARPAQTAAPEQGQWFQSEASRLQAEGGTDGSDLLDSDIRGGANGQLDKRGIYSLLKTQDYFSMLVIPPVSFNADVEPATYGAAIAFLDQPLNHKRVCSLLMPR